MAKLKFDIANIAEHRKKLGISQQIFWSSLGITQSGGSRYENSRRLPNAVAVLLMLRETGKIQQSDIDAALVAFQKAKK